jgi:VIT1/CCC1 family predicted Fe2+/Mn2+ transporter
MGWSTSPTATERPGRTAADQSSKQVLEPIERVSEVLFGLIMVLTFTGSLSVATAGRAEVREMLVGALGCNLAWGIIDGLLYLLGVLAEKGRALSTFRALHRTSDAAEGGRLIARSLPALIASVLEPAQLEAVRQRLLAVSDPGGSARLTWEDWKGALAVFLLVFVSTFPVVVPFLLSKDAHLALRLSNAIAVSMLLVCGYAVGRLTGYHAWGTALGMVALGLSLVAMTMALGG